jgi:hypothetical protein
LSRTNTEAATDEAALTPFANRNSFTSPAILSVVTLF